MVSAPAGLQGLDSTELGKSNFTILHQFTRLLEGCEDDTCDPFLVQARLTAEANNGECTFG